MQGLIPKSVRCEAFRWDFRKGRVVMECWPELRLALSKGKGRRKLLLFGTGHCALLCWAQNWRQGKACQFLKTLLLALSSKILQCVYYHLDAWGSLSREFYLRLGSQGLDFAPQIWCQKHCAELKWTMKISRFFKSPVWHLPLLWAFFLHST